MKRLITSLIIFSLLFVILSGFLSFRAQSRNLLGRSFAMLRTTTVFAQDNSISAGLAVSVPIAEQNVQDGDIISSTPQGYVLDKTAYDPTIYGIMVAKPAIALESNTPQAGFYPVMTVGKIYVRVANTNGNIKVGDYVTSSTTPGVGQKALTDGFVIGTALENFESGTTGKILVSVKPSYTVAVIGGPRGINLFSNMKSAASSPFLTPLTSMRYILAVLVTVFAFVIGFRTYGKIAGSGLEALGRNPLAARTISMSIMFNIGLAGVIVIAGLVIAYFILVL